LLQAEVEVIRGDASFTAEGNVIVDKKHVYKAKHILVATGGRPIVPAFPGTADLYMALYKYHDSQCSLLESAQSIYLFIFRYGHPSDSVVRIFGRP
jgi:pyruvate/2-oxoglutarate dehydrogenase complex dihydrolipoamide dehydrogenase (E3) component